MSEKRASLPYFVICKYEKIVGLRFRYLPFFSVNEVQRYRLCIRRVKVALVNYHQECNLRPQLIPCMRKKMLNGEVVSHNSLQKTLETFPGKRYIREVTNVIFFPAVVVCLCCPG